MSDQLTTEPRQTEQPPTGPSGPRREPPEDRPASRGGGAAVGWGIAFIAAGVLWILSLLEVPIAWELVLPAGIIIIGVALLAGVRGAARSGLISLGVVLAVVALFATLLPSRTLAATFTAGDNDVTVDTVADLDPVYEHGAGVLRLDLSDLAVSEGVTQVSASVNFGELIVIVPADVTVTGETIVRAGEVSIFGSTTAGFAPSATIDEAGTDEARVLDLDLDVGFGRIEVRR
jgi:predicted membrane protein